MAWHKIAETASLTQLQATWKLELYQELSSAPGSVETLVLQNDFKLRRGNPSARNKFQRILNTTVDFQIYDMSRWLIDTLRSAPEYEFKGIILKNSATYYAGYVTLLLDKLLYKNTNLEVGIKLYDGLNRLKEFTDLTDIGTGLISFKEIVRTIFNALNLNLDINAYQNIFVGSDENDPDARALWLEYFKIEDFINTLGKTASYYELLTTLADMFDLNVFQENGVWVLRQNASIKHVAVAATDGIWKEEVEYDTGNYDSSKVDLDRAIADTDLQVDPVSFEYQKLDQVEINIASYEPEKTPYLDDDDQVIWLNPNFVEGDRGWTTETGSPDFKDDSVYMNSVDGSPNPAVYDGDEITQESSALTSGDTVIISISVTSIRMILSDADVVSLLTPSNNPLVYIEFIGVTNNYKWNTNTNAWDQEPYTDPASYYAIGIGVTSPFVNGARLHEYGRSTLEFNLETTVPEDGTIKIHLWGGKEPTGNNYPFEQGAIHNYCSVIKKTDITDEPVSVPQRFKLKSFVADPKESRDINIPFADYIPFNGATIWYLEETVSPAAVNYYRAYDWSPDNGTLIKNIAERIIKQNRSRRGFDILLLPGKTLRFIDLVEADFESESASYYYLPVFEESILIADHKRFILLEHNYDSPTITTKHEFIFPNSNQQ